MKLWPTSTNTPTLRGEAGSAVELRDWLSHQPRRPARPVLAGRLDFGSGRMPTPSKHSLPGAAVSLDLRISSKGSLRAYAVGAAGDPSRGRTARGELLAVTVRVDF